MGHVQGPKNSVKLICSTIRLLEYVNTCATIYSIVFEHNDINTSVHTAVYTMHKYINSLFMVNASVNERRNINSKK